MPTGACLLTLDGLRKTYVLPAPLLSFHKGQGKNQKEKPKTKQAAAGVSLTLGPGLYGLLGPNGAGNLSSSVILSRRGFLRS